MFRFFISGLMVVLSVLMGSLGAFAGQNSVYTDVDTSVCQLVSEAEEGDGEWATFRCGGIQGLAVFVTEADLRFALGYGPDWQRQKSNSQFLSPFNTIGKKLEWRLQDGRVVATILRYFTDEGSGGRKGQILVVSKVTKDEACHVAYVDALANKGANQLARWAADFAALAFDCAKDHPMHLGRRGVSPF